MTHPRRGGVGHTAGGCIENDEHSQINMKDESGIFKETFPLSFGFSYWAESNFGSNVLKMVLYPTPFKDLEKGYIKLNIKYVFLYVIPLKCAM